MKLKEAFKPNRFKVIVSIAVLIAYFIFLNNYFRMMCKCASGGFENCVDYEFLELVHINCHCACTSLITAIFTNIKLFLPSIITYLIYSVIQFFSKKGEKNEFQK